MALKGTEKVLEIGFGTGGTQVRLKSKFPKLDLFGIERSEVMLRKAKSRLRWAMLPSNQLFIDDGKNQHYPFPSMVLMSFSLSQYLASYLWTKSKEI
ncbi:MAG: class I SAM-dependent methyltransferase [Saprospiraceae bacterium]|nr:class I SAM-dependent methyltransferase [Saprospiraceae bacterium]